MIFKLLLWAALASVLCKLAAGSWPWQLAGLEPGGWGSRSAETLRARALLGVRGNASRTDIIEAHKRLVAQVHPDRGGTDAQVHEANAARDVLLARLLNSSD